MTTKGKILRIISILMVIALVVAIVVSMSKKEGSDKPIAEVAVPVAEAFENDLTVLAEENAVKKIFALNPADFEGTVYYMPTSNLYATEMLIVKMKDADQAEELEAAIELRIASQSNIFDGYMSDQYALCGDAIVDINGNYALYAVGENAENADKAFKKALK